MAALSSMLRISVGLLTVGQFVLVFLAAIYGILVAQAYGDADDDDKCVSGFGSGDPVSFEMTQVGLLVVAGIIIVVMFAAKAFELDSENMYQQPMTMVVAICIGVSLSVGVATAITGRCERVDDNSVTSDFEAFVWTVFSLLLVTAFIQVTAHTERMDTDNRMADISNWSVFASLNIFRFIFLVTLVAMMGDGTLYELGKTNNHAIDLHSATGPAGRTCQHALILESNANHSGVRDALDKFKAINIVESLAYNGTVSTTVATTAGSTATTVAAATTPAPPAPSHLINGTLLKLDKVEAYNPMLACLYIGFVAAVLASGLAAVSLVFRVNFSVFDLSIPGMFEKSFQLTADIVTSLFIASLLLENEMNGCQMFNLSNATVQTAYVSAFLYVYIVVVQAFLTSVRRLMHMSDGGGAGEALRNIMAYASM